MTLDLTDLHDLVSAPIGDSMKFLNEVAQEFPDAVSFAAGRPYEGFFDLDAVHRHFETFRDHLRTMLGGDEAAVRRTLLQYGRTKGIITDLIARNLLVDEDITVDPESIVVTVGCQEALYLTLRALHRTPQDALIAVRPCYAGVAGAAQLVDMPLVPVAENATGIDLDDLVAAIGRARAVGLRPRACYVMADFANPSGVSLDLAERERLLRISDEHDLLLLEDNPYGLFHGGTRPPPRLKALDRAHRVIYLGTYAKTVMPGARVGYVVADQPVTHGGLLADQLAKLKSMLTVNTSPLAQAVIGGKLLENDCSLRSANVRETQVYQTNLERLLNGLARRFGPGSGVSWNEPTGGFFLILTLPFPAGDDLLLHAARKHGVLWTPLHHFFGDGVARPQLRLSFSHLTPDEIDVGLDRLANFIDEQRPARSAIRSEGE